MLREGHTLCGECIWRRMDNHWYTCIYNVCIYIYIHYVRVCYIMLHIHTYYILSVMHNLIVMNTAFHDLSRTCSTLHCDLTSLRCSHASPSPAQGPCPLGQPPQYIGVFHTKYLYQYYLKHISIVPNILPNISTVFLMLFPGKTN